MEADVTICIPTYKSEDFIDRTLHCARSQTYGKISIVVSVDHSEDNTAEICERHAGEDGRIKILLQPERLGWSRNANAVLDCVDTDYFFIYFHDDIISPDYVEKLLKVLAERPDAASAHCDLLEYGLEDIVKPANTYDGPTLRRLVEFMMTQRGTMLRSMVRRKFVGDALRFPSIHGDNHWTAYVFHLLLLAAGPAVGLHETLYRRWQREGSLTRSKGWNSESLDDVLRGQKESTRLCLDLIGRVLCEKDEIMAARYCLRLFQMNFIRNQQQRLNTNETISSCSLSPLLDPSVLYLKPCVLDAEARAWVKAAEMKLGENETGNPLLAFFRYMKSKFGI